MGGLTVVCLTVALEDSKFACQMRPLPVVTHPPYPLSPRASVAGLGLSRAVKAERRLHRISARLAEPSRSSPYRSWHFCGVGYQFQTHGFIILHITGIQTIQCTMKGLHKDYHTTADYQYNKRWHKGGFWGTMWEWKV